MGRKSPYVDNRRIQKRDKGTRSLFLSRSIYINKEEVVRLLEEGWEMGKRKTDNPWIHRNIWIQEGGLLKSGKCHYITEGTLNALLNKNVIVGYDDKDKDWLIRYELTSPRGM